MGIPSSKQIWTGAVIGAASGLLASIVMNAVPSIWSQIAGKDQQSPSGQDQSEDATVKTARRLAEPVLHRPLTEDEKNAGGPLVHFAFGASVGALYGALAPPAPVITLGFGAAYATAVWLLGDVVTVPALGLAPPPSQTPASGHAKYWLMHAIYGLALEASRRVITKTVDSAD